MNNINNNINLTNLFRALSTVSFAMTFYGLMENKSINEILEQLEKERNNNKVLYEKYNKLLVNKLNESELNNIVSEEKTKSLMEEITDLKSKISNPMKDSDNSEGILTQLKDISQTFKKSNNDLNSILESIEKYVNSKNNNNFIDSFTELFTNLNNIILNMSIEQKLAYLHISGSFFILLSLFSIISIFYGDYLITKLNLENRFPKIAKYIQLRRKFQHFYIITDIIISIIILLIIMYINIIFYF